MVTRPTSISGGNYGIVGDNGQITKVENNSTIVNETNNTYYNPATGQTQPITNWAYDYSDRSYTLTLEGGKTSTVTYGDEYITIQEGDTVYNVYYVVDDSGTENPPAACTHDWQETSTTPATCTASGSKVLTCSKCQQTKAETLPALGHNWQETKSTPATCTLSGSRLLTCSKYQQAKYITIPSLRPIIIMMFILAVGGIFSSDFGLFYQVSRGANQPLTNVVSTLDVQVYHMLRSATTTLGQTSAASMFQAVVGCITILSANAIVRHFDRASALI